MAVDVNRFRKFVSLPANKPADDIVQEKIDFAVTVVAGKGVSSTHTKFDTLVMLYTAHLCQQSGELRSGPLTGRKIDGLSEQFAAPSETGNISWLEMYTREMRALNFTGRRFG